METDNTSLKSVQQAWVCACVKHPPPKALKKAHASTLLQFQASSRAYHDQLAALLCYGHQSTSSWSNHELYWYQILEQARCDSLAIADFKGIAINICAALEQHTECLIQNALYLLCTRYFWPVGSHPAIDMDNTSIVTRLPTITPSVLERAARQLQEPEKFETCVSGLVAQLAKECHLKHPVEKTVEKLDSGTSADESISNLDNRPDTTPADADEALEADTGQSESASLEELSNSHTGSSNNNNNSPQQYSVFSTEYDEIVYAADIVTNKDHQAFKRLRAAENTAQRRLVRKIAHRLQRKLMIANQRTWLFDQEKGSINPASLSRLITQAQFTRVFREEAPSPLTDTVVSLLVDQSGSMQGGRSRMAALSVDVIVSVLESCAIKCEVLGYTTRYWAENPLEAAWRRCPGKKPPGRLNATRHIIYKKADTPWRHVAHHCGIMLRSDFGRENIDGEALLWSSQRLQQRYEPNKILLVLSDGSPMDEATLSANSKNLLANHLRYVIRGIEAEGKIQLAAIGIAHKVGYYYSRAIEIDDERAIGEALITKLTEMIIPNPDKRS